MEGSPHKENLIFAAVVFLSADNNAFLLGMVHAKT
jgi:hypothetical protein